MELRIEEEEGKLFKGMESNDKIKLINMNTGWDGQSKSDGMFLANDYFAKYTTPEHKYPGDSGDKKPLVPHFGEISRYYVDDRDSKEDNAELKALKILDKYYQYVKNKIAELKLYKENINSMKFAKFISRDYIRFGHGLFLIDFLNKNFITQISADRVTINNAYTSGNQLKINIVKDTSKKFFDEEVFDAQGNIKDENKRVKNIF